MIITENFVILNFPKTGSSFVRKVIKEIFIKKRQKNFFYFNKILNRLKIKSFGFEEIMTDHPTIPGYRDQHGCFDQIPEKDKSKRILSVIRDPYLRLESMYKFGWWIKNPPIEKQQIKTMFPDFPDLSFHQFLEMQLLSNEKLKYHYHVDPALKIGVQSIQFIRFFFKNHKKILADLTSDYITTGKYKNDMCNVTFLRNENLNVELARFLSQNGFSKEEVDFVINHKKVNVSKYNMNKISSINQDLIRFVNENEWILLTMLASFGINYKRE